MLRLPPYFRNISAFLEFNCGAVMAYEEGGFKRLSKVNKKRKMSKRRCLRRQA
jgi:hypothetical protein